MIVKKYTVYEIYEHSQNTKFLTGPDNFIPVENFNTKEEAEEHLFKMETEKNTRYIIWETYHSVENPIKTDPYLSKIINHFNQEEFDLFGYTNFSVYKEDYEDEPCYYIISEYRPKNMNNMSHSMYYKFQEEDNIYVKIYDSYEEMAFQELEESDETAKFIGKFQRTEER
jgi:hypothetical protein